MKSFRKNSFTKLAAIGTILIAVLATGGISVLNSASVSAAATNSLYLSSSVSSVQQGSSFTVSLRLNPDPTKPVDSVQGSVGYDASKLTLQGVDCTGSPFTPEPSPSLGCPASGNPVTITGANFSGGVGSDSFVASFTFKAVAGSGTSSISVSGDSAINGTAQNTSKAGTSVSFTTPAAPTCAAGQTGTYPNCVTPNSGGTGAGSGGTKTTTPPAKTTTPKTTNTTPTKVTTADGTTTVAAKTVQYTQASFTTTSKSATQVYIQFGTSADALTQQTALSDSSTTHTINIDSTQLLPGQTYYYVVVSKTTAGTVTQTAVDSFVTNGLTVRVGVFDKNHQPIANKKITLHSTPATATTDSKGFATFSNVASGTHHVVYVSGKKSLDQQIDVANNVQTSGATQTAAVQNVSVVYPISSGSTLGATKWIIIGFVLVVAVVGFILFSRRKLRFAVPGGAPLSAEPVVVGGSGSSNMIQPKAAETTQRLNSIPDPNKPAPGSTVAPGVNEEKKF